MKAVIMAGGKGTRLGSLTVEIPKPMVIIDNKPILEHQIDNLKQYGINEIILIVGYLGNVIEDYFLDGSKFGVNITYIHEKELLGTAGSLFYLKNKVDGDFVLLFGDLMLDINWNRFICFHKDKNALITLFAHPNSHPYDSDLIVCDETNKVIKIDSKHNIRNYYYKNLVNAGLYILNSKILEIFKKAQKLDFEKDILPIFMSKDKVYAYISSEYVKDAGTIERLNMVTNDYLSGIMHQKNLSHKQKCIFLDRDGTINKYVGFLRNIDDFELLSGVSEAIKLINHSDYLCVVVTNQPVIARGEVSFVELENIHHKMETLLGEDGSYLDAIYYCPHHPDKGFKGERVELKIHCDCRKPNIGMLLKAKDKFNIDFSKSYFIGDSDVDVKTARNANIKSILIDNDALTHIEKPTYYASSLLEAVKLILKSEEAK